MSRPRKPPSIEAPPYDNEAVSFERSVFQKDLQDMTPRIPPRSKPKLAVPDGPRDTRPPEAVGRPPQPASPAEKRYLKDKRRQRAREERQQRDHPLQRVEPQLMGEVKKGFRT